MLEFPLRIIRRLRGSPSARRPRQRRRSWLGAIALLWWLAGLVPGSLASPAEQAYLHELILRARDAGLSEKRHWQVLLHYKRNLTGGWTSEQDDPGFFLAPTGKTDPEAELEATLAQFFSTELVGRSKQPAQCAFVARYHWLKASLAFDDRRLPPLPCDRFDRWLAELDAAGVTLIFPTAFMNNPASMFGHTLLRLDRKGQTESTRILAYTINYAADVPPNIGIEYMFLGVFGGYQGYFSTIPYYLKVQEYRDIEHRDIWEYRLNLTEEQTRSMLMHAWELGNAYFDYFFFKENCSYHLLALLEAANPTWHLTDQFVFWTMPGDTVRLLFQQPGLVGDIAFRPSRATVIKRKREQLSPDDARWLSRLTTDETIMHSREFQALPSERQALLLDIASDYLRYRIENDQAHAEEYRARNRAVLTARSALRMPSPQLTIEPETEQPESGHRTSRASLGVGWRNDEWYQEVAIRAAYHDLLDPQQGFTPGAQIELLGATLRYYDTRNQVRLERFTLADIVSLSPVDRLFQSPSWKVAAGMNTITWGTCALCSNWVLNGGPGLTVESRWLRREFWFAFVEGEGAYSQAYTDDYRVGGGGTIGSIVDLSERWRLMVTGSYLRFPLGDDSEDIRWFVGQRYTLAQNWALRLEYQHRHDDDDIVFRVQAFF